MADFSTKGRVFITCAKAMPPHLEQELRALGFPVTATRDAGVETTASLDDAMTLNLRLRTAHRVLFLLAEFKARDAAELYRRMAAMPWEDYLEPSETLSIGCAVENETIRDTRFPALKAKDAIVDRIRDVAGRRPDAGPDQTGFVVFLYWSGEAVMVYLDTSGEPLSRRGYRKIPLKAPMQETLAAGVLMASGWDARTPLVNPMCGSGTIAIEAALQACGRMPGSIRANFGFMHVRGYDPVRWKRMVRDARLAEVRPTVAIFASDIDQRAVDAARKNAVEAGVAGMIRFDTCDFRETPLPDGAYTVILNPEYGERLGDEDALVGTYKDIGDFFKQKCRGAAAFVFTGNLKLAKAIGLRSRRRIAFFNSRIECRLLDFEVYEGTRKPGNQPPAE